METKRNNSLKRAAAGVLSVLTVAAYSLPANAGILIAHGADDPDVGSCTVEFNDSNASFKFSSSSVINGSYKTNSRGNEFNGKTAVGLWNVTVPEGKTMYINYFVSSDQTYDTLSIGIDNVPDDGNDDYEWYVASQGDGSDGIVELTEGTYRVKAEYSKDEEFSYGLDTAYIKFFEEGKNALPSLLTVEGIAEDDFVVANGGEATLTKPLSDNDNPMFTYWFKKNEVLQNECTIYSNCRLKFFDKYNEVPCSEKAELIVDGKNVKYSGKTYAFKYTLKLKDSSIGRAINITGENINENNFSELLMGSGFFERFHTYDGNLPTADDFKFTIDENIDNERKELISGILNSPDTTKEFIPDDENADVNAGNDITGKLKITNSTLEAPIEIVTSCTITKRKVAVTPKPNQSKIYYEENPQEIEYTIETENDNTGVLAADINNNFQFYLTPSCQHDSDAGEYAYYIYENNSDPNYNFDIAEDSPLFVVKPRDISDVEIRMDKNQFIYDGEFHTPVVNEIFDNTTERSLSNNDYEFGGDVKRRSKGNYTLQINGQNNYTGLTTADWSIVNGKGYIDVLESSKVYDGKPITNMFEVNTDGFEENEKYIIKYFDDNDTELAEAPSDVGSYKAELWCNNGEEKCNYAYFTINAKSLNSPDIEITLDNNPTVLTDSNDWTSPDEITVFDKTTGKELVCGTEDKNVRDEDGNYLYDFYVADNIRTKLPGVYKIEIVGAGNYSGYTSTDWTVTSLVLDNAITISDPVLYNGKARFISTPVIPEGCTAEESGIIFLKENTDNITAGNAKSELIVHGTKKAATVATNVKALNISPVNDQTIWAMAYVTVNVNGVQTTLYTEPKSAKVSELVAADENIRADLSDAVFNAGKARFISTPVIPEGCTAKESGIIFIKENTENISSENAKNELIARGTKKPATVATNTKALNISPVNDHTIWAVAYVIIDVNGQDVVKYSEPKSAVVSELAMRDAGVGITLSDPVLNNGKARFISTPVVPEEYTASESGIIFIKENTESITADNAKDILIADGTKKPATVATNTKALNITPVNDQTIWAMAYVTVTKDGQTMTFYSDAKSAKVSELN